RGRLFACTASRKTRTVSSAAGAPAGMGVLPEPLWAQAPARSAVMTARPAARADCGMGSRGMKFNRSNLTTPRNTKQATMRLYINVDHVATIRQARRAAEPDPVAAGLECERHGADGVTVHLREDRRHIQDDDVRRLAASVTKVLNVELATSREIVALTAELRPHQATFVPEKREEITTEGGLDLATETRRKGEPLRHAIERLKSAGVRVSLFVDPDAAVLDHAARLGVAAVEL